MPKYLLIGLGVMAILFVSMHYWGKLSNQGKDVKVFNITEIKLFGLPTHYNCHSSISF